MKFSLPILVFWFFTNLKYLTTNKEGCGFSENEQKQIAEAAVKKTPEFKRAHFLIRLLWKPVPIKLPQNADSAQSQDKSIYFK